jgi:hypothetical protein
MPKSLAALAIASAALASGCGQPPTDADQIRAVIRDWGRSLAAGGGQRHCRMMTAGFQQRIVRDNPQLPGDSCAEVSAALSAIATPDQVSELNRLATSSVKVTGDRAAALLRPASILTGTGVARLRRVGGHWLVDNIE